MQGEMDTYYTHTTTYVYINEVRLEVTIPDIQSYHMVWILVGNFKISHLMHIMCPTSNTTYDKISKILMVGF